MPHNPLEDIQDQYKQQKLEAGLKELTAELVKINAKLDKIESLLDNKEDKSVYIK